MKTNLFVLLLGSATGILSIFGVSCKKNSCDGSKSIVEISPSSNPLGFEVIIEIEGFSNEAVVSFGGKRAESRLGAENQIIARVSSDLVGPVEVSIEEGDCIERLDNFEVLSNLPTDIQPSLTNIVLPILPSLPPINFNNTWLNAADNATGIQLYADEVGNLYPDSYEFNYAGNELLNYNPVSGTVDTVMNKIYMEVDRTSKGGNVEKFDGQFVVPPLNAQHAILLVSRQTGRQLLLLFP